MPVLSSLDLCIPHPEFAQVARLIKQDNPKLRMVIPSHIRRADPESGAAGDGAPRAGRVAVHARAAPRVHVLVGGSPGLAYAVDRIRRFVRPPLTITPPLWYWRRSRRDHSARVTRRRLLG